MSLFFGILGMEILLLMKTHNILIILVEFTVELYVFTNDGCLVDTVTTEIVVNLSTSIESLNQEERLLKIVDVLGRDSHIKKEFYFILFI